MANKFFPLEPNAPTRLQISAKGDNVRIFLDEILLGDATFTQARHGLSYTLADGRVLRSVFGSAGSASVSAGFWH